MKRLAGGPATHFRTTDHSGEIAWLRLMAIQSRDHLTELTYSVAAELLEGHDATGWSLDNWPDPRSFVEFLLGHEILDNGI